MRYNESGNNNIGIGYQSLYRNQIGKENIAIGKSSGEWIKGDGNIQIGNTISSNDNSTELDRVVAVGHGFGRLDASTGMDDTILLGENDSNIKVGIGTYKPVAKLEVNGGIKVGKDGGSCTPDKIGTLTYGVSGRDKEEGKDSYSNLYLCDGKAWRKIMIDNSDEGM